MANDYEGILDDWKLRLIVERAKSKGFREDDIEDAQQEIVLELLAFQFDPEKSNCGTERTAVTTLINNRLTSIQRSQTRRRKSAQRYQDIYGHKSDSDLLDWSQQEAENRIDLHEDMKVVIRRLEPMEKAICVELAAGNCRDEVCRSLGLSRRHLDRMIEDVAERMRKAGF